MRSDVTAIAPPLALPKNYFCFNVNIIHEKHTSAYTQTCVYNTRIYVYIMCLCLRTMSAVFGSRIDLSSIARARSRTRGVSDTNIISETLSVYKSDGRARADKCLFRRKPVFRRASYIRTWRPGSTRMDTQYIIARLRRMPPKFLTPSPLLLDGKTRKRSRISTPQLPTPVVYLFFCQTAVHTGYILKHPLCLKIKSHEIPLFFSFPTVPCSQN